MVTRTKAPAGRGWMGRGVAGWTRCVGAALLAGSVTGCAGSTVGSGVGEVRLEAPPYYAAASGERARLSGTPRTVAYLPVTYQRGAIQPGRFEPSHADGTAMAKLTEALSLHLDFLASERGWHSVDPLPGAPPDVQFGCVRDEFEECAMEGEDGMGDQDTQGMRLAVTRGDRVWTDGVPPLLAEAGADALLVLTLEVGEYWPRQTNWRGSKAVELGTDRVVSLPWLTALDAPVQVIQLTGVLVAPDGRAVRMGAEGLRARRTPILASGFGLRAVIDDEEVESLLSERAGEAPDSPLVWQVALEVLVDQLAEGLRPARPGS